MWRISGGRLYPCKGSALIQHFHCEEKMARAKVKIEMDGQKLSVLEGTTILKAAQDADISIPTLCHRPDLTP
ncbi:MAG: (2Fe-2S)-binding protein, partial [Deltaproteobacteria bacterium]|nr:(2Fe-2S)-binding protein [Deltaproteobacteria bacterium]